MAKLVFLCFVIFSRIRQPLTVSAGHLTLGFLVQLKMVSIPYVTQPGASSVGRVSQEKRSRPLQGQKEVSRSRCCRPHQQITVERCIENLDVEMPQTRDSRYIQHFSFFTDT